MAKDQYKYFRMEARELVEALNQAVLELEREGNRKEPVARLLHLAHTLKGASRVVKQPEIADIAHGIEDVFAPFREGGYPIPQGRITEVLGLLDSMAAKVSALDTSLPESPRETTRAGGDEAFETIRVEIEEMDRLLDGVTEASIQLRSLRSELEALDRARQLAGNLLESVSLQRKSEGDENKRNGHKPKLRDTAEDLRGYFERVGRNILAGIDQVEAEFAQIRDAAHRLRLLPAAAVFPSLERDARDAAQLLHKEVAFESFGGTTRLDAHVLAALRDALMHIVRNAVAHGIELSQDRLLAKKPALGHVELRVEQRGARLAFLCSDDGRGIDVEAVRRVAIRRGFIAADTLSLGLEDAIRIILKGGVTTTGSIDEVSGRGIGLDVVRETAARLKGAVAVRSEPGKGTTFEICVPVSLSSLAALEMDADGILASLPIAAVRRIVRLAEEDIARSAEADSILYEDRAIPFLNLAAVLRRKTPPHRKRRFWSAIVLEGASGLAAIGADRLLGAAQIVARPLPSLAVAEAIVTGASLNTEGDPQLVLDPNALVTAAQLGRAIVAETPAFRRPTILVIDDSLTTRMLEQSILESAGYEVDLATSAEEALEKARAKEYGLFLVDVEMPGMDGFEFVSRPQADPRLNAVPSILVTSRNALDDRRRGEEVGARAYIVKGEFDQGYLLRVTRELIG